MPLSELKIKSAKPSDKRYEICDSNGLYLQVMTSGNKYWRVRHAKDNKRTWYTIGEYPIVSLQEARRKRDELFRQLADGTYGKPQISFADVAEEWFQAHSRKLKSEKERVNIKSRLDAHILPYLGHRGIGDIKPVDILPLLQRLADRGTFEMANRVRQICGQVFRYAVASGRTETDPTAVMRGAIVTPPSKHHAAVTQPQDIRQLLLRIDAYSSKLIRLALWFSALVFARPGEVRHAEWSEIDLDRAEWRNPGDKMKIKREKDKVHIVPLSRQAVAVLTEVKKMSGEGRYVFPSSRTPRGDRPMSENTVLAALRSLGYIKDEMTAHGFRTMASTVLNENGFNRDWIERQLDHREKNSVRAAYNAAEYLDGRKEMMQWYADYLDRLRDGTA